MDWFRMYGEFANDPKWCQASAQARLVAEIAHEHGEARRTCYPNWQEVELTSGLKSQAFVAAFEELCEIGIVFSGFPSFLPALADRWPLAPMFGPVAKARPSAEVWRSIRLRIFERDDFTCQYCGARGVPLECDHVTPVAQGGTNDDENLVAACRDCNRAKGARTPEQWRAV